MPSGLPLYSTVDKRGFIADFAFRHIEVVVIQNLDGFNHKSA